MIVHCNFDLTILFIYHGISRALSDLRAVKKQPFGIHHTPEEILSPKSSIHSFVRKVAQKMQTVRTFRKVYFVFEKKYFFNHNNTGTVQYIGFFWKHFLRSKDALLFVQNYVILDLSDKISSGRWWIPICSFFTALKSDNALFLTCTRYMCTCHV